VIRPQPGAYAILRRFPFGAGIKLIRGVLYVTVVVTTCFTVTLSSLASCSWSLPESSASSSSSTGHRLVPPLRGLSVDGEEFVLDPALVGLGGRPPRADLLPPIGADKGAGYGVAGV
jgi:hypothetical protein